MGGGGWNKQGRGEEDDERNRLMIAAQEVMKRMTGECGLRYCN